MRDSIFKRNTEEYSNNLDDIMTFKEMNNDDIILIPGTDKLIAYYDGKPICFIGNRLWKRFSNSYDKYFKNNDDTNMCELFERIKGKGNKKHFYMNQEEMKIIKQGVGNGLPNDRERKSQQVIAQKHTSYNADKYSICGMETAIPKEMINGTTRGIGKQAEIDLVALCPENKEILLIEYKCQVGPTTGGITDSVKKWNWDEAVDGKEELKNIAAHCKDYLAVLESDRLGEFVLGMIKAYNLLAEINGKDTRVATDNDTLQEYINNIRIVFLLTNIPKKGKESGGENLTIGTYESVKKYMDKIIKLYYKEIERLSIEKRKKFERNVESIRYYAAVCPEAVNINDGFVTLSELKYPFK